MIAKNPDDRFYTAAAVEEALHRWISDEPAKPLDRQTDQEYEHAIAALEMQEPSRELMHDVIPMGILISGPGDAGSPASARRRSNPNVPVVVLPAPTNLIRYGALVAGGFLLGILGLLGLVYLWMSR
jgi:hypothetical protein